MSSKLIPKIQLLCFRSGFLLWSQLHFMCAVVGSLLDGPNSFTTMATPQGHPSSGKHSIFKETAFQTFVSNFAFRTGYTVENEERKNGEGGNAFHVCF